MAARRSYSTGRRRRRRKKKHNIAAILFIAVILGITYGYAESCSCGQCCLSYQISGCGEQACACCSGQWCSWGTSSCASCTATSTTNARNCSGNVSGACAGTQTQKTALLSEQRTKSTRPAAAVTKLKIESAAMINNGVRGKMGKLTRQRTVRKGANVLTEKSAQVR